MHATAAEAQRAVREHRYRDRGWWPGERLESRYARHVQARPGALAVVDDRGGRFTHRALWDAAERLAAGLAARGVTPGARVLLYLPNRSVWQVALLAVLRLRAVPASIPVTTDAGTLAYAADLAGARTALTAERLGDRRVADAARDAARQCEAGLDVGVLDDAGECAWSETPPPRPAPDAPPWLDHVMFTSSTTGMPKAVMHSADTLAALNVTFTGRFDLGAERAVFMSSPLGHSVGAIHGARLTLFNGAPLVLQERWDPQAALRLVDEHRCDFTAAATPFLKDLVDAQAGPRPKLASMRTFLCGGAGVPPALMLAADEQFPDTFVSVLWGMTEGGLTTCTRDSPRGRRLATAGTGLPGLETVTLSETGAPAPAGAEGELAMRGPGVFLGYLAQEDLYRSLLTPDGFFRTGDLACIDGHGYVRITGRLKDLIIRGGVNISPVPTEDALAAHPAVRSVAVIGLPDERLGERICAVVEPNGARPDLDTLIAFAAAGGLAKRQWPESLRFVDEMPRTAAGKIRKVELRERIAAGEA